MVSGGVVCDGAEEEGPDWWFIKIARKFRSWSSGPAGGDDVTEKGSFHV
jgi:hypothetical protein